jgi:SAM-dependent methyltransferase
MMAEDSSKYNNYFLHLKTISLLGRIYKKLVSSPILFFCARRFGRRMVEIGSGTGSGVLGAFPKHVHGLEINPLAVEFCKAAGLNVQLINDGDAFPVADCAYDVCILDNVLEHIEEPRNTLDECYRITQKNGGLIIVVPGVRGYDSDPDHKKFYAAEAVQRLDERWSLQSLFSLPFLFSSVHLSRYVKQYCLVAIYKKNHQGVQ